MQNAMESLLSSFDEGVRRQTEALTGHVRRDAAGGRHALQEQRRAARRRQPGHRPQYNQFFVKINEDRRRLGWMVEDVRITIAKLPESARRRGGNCTPARPNGSPKRCAGRSRRCGRGRGQARRSIRGPAYAILRQAPADRAGEGNGSFWLSFSDMMSALVLVFILVVFTASISIST
jgi:hypothetical protein